MDVGDGDPAQIVCGAPNVAAGQTVAVAQPGAVMPDGTSWARPSCAGVESQGMILAEDELGHRHRPRRDPGARRRPRRRARRWPTCCRSRPTSSSWRSRRTGPTASASTASRARSTRPPARRSRRTRRGRRTRARRRAAEGAAGRGRGPRAVPALHRARLRGREDRPVAAVAEGAAHGRRPAPDQQRRRHHELRDAPDGPAAARVRPGPRCAADRLVVRSARDGERASRRSTATSASSTPTMVVDLRRRRPDLASPA